jgi:hypothetical protein
MGASPPSDGCRTGAVADAVVAIGATDAPVFIVNPEYGKEDGKFKAACGKDRPASYGVPQVEGIQQGYLDKEKNNKDQGDPVVSFLIRSAFQQKFISCEHVRFLNRLLEAAILKNGIAVKPSPDSGEVKYLFKNRRHL